jgi:tetratricopeptide (TPR) repeat protein
MTGRRQTGLRVVGGLLIALTFAASAHAQPAAAGGDRERLLQQAAQELSQGRRQDAARSFSTAAERFGSVQAWLQLARIQSGDGDAAAALESLGRARLLAPNSEEVLTAFAQVSLAARNPLPAVRALQALTRLCSTAPEYHYQLGVALMVAGDMPAATEALERAEQLDPRSGRTLIALGLALNEQKRYAEARPYLVRGLNASEGHADALAALAEAEEGLGQLELAAVHAGRALEMDTAHGVANLVTGMLAMRDARYGDARDAFLKAVAATPVNPKAHYQLSLAYARLGDEGSAKTHVDLYQQQLRDSQERLRSLRGEGRPRR